MPRTRRGPEARMRLAAHLTFQLADSPGRGKYGVTLGWNAETGPRVEISEPDRAAVRDLLTDARKFDSPGEDVYLPELIDCVLSQGVAPDWIDGLKDARAHYLSTQQASDLKVRDIDRMTDDPPVYVSPREAFELWAYGEHFHNDLDKIQRLERFPAPGRVLIRALAHDYLNMLLSVSHFVTTVIVYGLDPQLSPPIAVPDHLQEPPADGSAAADAEAQTP